jgi:hypothetical protein
MAMVGRNPQLVNQLVTTALQGARAEMQGAPAVSGPGLEPPAPRERR